MKLRGAKVAVVSLEETFDTKILVPQERNITYNLGKVLFVGDGRCGAQGEKEVPIFVHQGDILMFQMNSVQAGNALFMWDDKPTLILDQGDMIARLRSTTVTTEGFEILGRWLLVEPYLVQPKGGLIQIPDTVEENLRFTELMKYRLVQKGHQCEGGLEDVAIGDEMIVERMMCHRIDIDGKNHAFISADYIYGHVVNDTMSVVE